MATSPVSRRCATHCARDRLRGCPIARNDLRMSYFIHHSRRFRFAVLLVAGVVSACGGSGGTTDAGGTVDAGESLQAILAGAAAEWAAAKPSCPAYRYQSQRSSVFGFCSTTTIEIANDQAIRRSFIHGASGCSPDAAATEQWDEVNAGEIGSHSDGEPAHTVEQLLADCQTILAVHPAQYGLFLSVGPQGVPMTCMHRLIKCTDDCSSGIQIPNFTCQAPPPVDASAG
jgi:hypothetical protein